ncbi:major facilitator superfamily protein [Sarocladium implicatum]|nr:major facilitator superfamily protein [Sarocladium implicatum]
MAASQKDMPAPPAASGVLPPAAISEAAEASPVTDKITLLEPPDGGLRAWIQVAVGCLLNALCWGMPISFGVSQLYYTETLGLPASQISWIGSIQLFLTFGMSAASGRLTDAGFIRSTVVSGSFLAVLGIFMTSIAKEYWQIFLAQGVCLGIGLGLLFMPAISIVSSYFKERRAFALTLAASGSGVGGLAFPSTLQFLTPQIGFRWAMRCVGFTVLAISIVVLLLMRPRLPPRKSGPLVEWAAFRELPYTLFLMGALLYFLALFFGFFYINSYARYQIGFSNIESVHLLLINNAMGIPGRPTAGYISDRWLGPINTFTILVMSFAMLMFAWSGVATRTGMYVFSVFLGLIVGASQGILAASLASLTKDPQKMGTRMGMVLTLCGFASLAGPPIAGAIIDSSGGNYLGAQIWGGCLLLASAVVLTGARIAAGGWVWKAKI